MVDAFLTPELDDHQLLARVLNYYNQSLKDSPEALGYLPQRGITSAQAIEQFRLGYANRTLGTKLPTKDSQAGRDLRGRLHQLRLFRDTGHEHFAGCIVFPVLAADNTGRIVDLYGRKTGCQLRKGTPLDMYLSDERHGVWNVEAMAASEEVILCPSVFDALTFWCQGYRHVTCTFGVERALTDDHLAAFQEFKVRRVLVLCDTIVPRLLEAGLDCYRLHFPVGLDVHGYASQANDPADALGSVIRRAEWLGKGDARPTTTVPVAIRTNGQPILPAAVADDVNGHDTFEQAIAEQTPITMATEPPTRTASPLPPAPRTIDAAVRGDEVLCTFGDRRYRVRGWNKNLSFDQLCVNLLASNDHGLFVDTFDLYAAKHRRAFVVRAAVELGVTEQVIEKDVGRVLLKLEELQDLYITQALTPKNATPQMANQERTEALQLLRDPRLLDRIVADIAVAGETSNKLIGYLAAISRKLDEPLAVVIQSSTAAGKTSLMNAVLACVPPEDLVKYSAMTGQSLFYLGASNLQHKVLAIAEGEGAERAGYALKLLQSEGELTIASTGKDVSSGRLVTHEYRVQGPVMLFLTTSVPVDEELLNRCLVLSVDEDREQTQAIHRMQRRQRTLDGLLARQDRQQTLTLHRNAQRLLRPLLVVNPFAEQLTFLDDKTRCRRDHAKYLTLIEAVAFLHQYQRPVKTVEHRGRSIEYIEVTRDDIHVTNHLAHEALGRSLDELPPQTRRLLNLIDAMVAEACTRWNLERAVFRFSRRDVREHTGWGHTQLKIHLRRLVDHEYLLIHRGPRGRSFHYELLFEQPTGEQPCLLARLRDVDTFDRSGRVG